MQAMQELVSRMTDKCFAKCTTKSGNKLDSKVTQTYHTHTRHATPCRDVCRGIPLGCRLVDSVGVGGRDS